MSRDLDKLFLSIESCDSDFIIITVPNDVIESGKVTEIKRLQDAFPEKCFVAIPEDCKAYGVREEDCKKIIEILNNSQNNIIILKNKGDE